MNIRILWLAFALLIISAICIPKLYAEDIAICRDDGSCIISEEMLMKMVNALEYWYKQAKTCKQS